MCVCVDCVRSRSLARSGSCPSVSASRSVSRPGLYEYFYYVWCKNNDPLFLFPVRQFNNHFQSRSASSLDGASPFMSCVGVLCTITKTLRQRHSHAAMVCSRLTHSRTRALAHSYFTTYARPAHTPSHTIGDQLETLSACASVLAKARGRCRGHSWALPGAFVGNRSGPVCLTLAARRDARARRVRRFPPHASLG